MADQTALSVVEALKTTGGESLDVPELSKYTIEGWQTKYEQESYQDKPFGQNYRLLELAAQKDPESTAARLKGSLDNADSIENVKLENISAAAIYKEMIEGKGQSEVKWDDFISKTKELARIQSAVFDDLISTSEMQLKDGDVLDIEKATNILEGLVGERYEFFVLQLEDMVFYVGSRYPETYGTDHALDIRYASGDNLRRIEIEIRLKQYDSGPFNSTYAVETTPSIQVIDPLGLDKEKMWIDGALDEVVIKYGKRIDDANDMLQRWKRLQGRSDSDTEKYRRLVEKIEKLDGVIVKARDNLGNLVSEQTKIQDSEE